MRAVISTLLLCLGLWLMLLSPGHLRPAQAQFSGQMFVEGSSAPACNGYQGPGDLGFGTAWSAWLLTAFSASTCGTSAIDITRTTDSDVTVCTVSTLSTGASAGQLDISTGTPCGGSTVTSWCSGVTCHIKQFYDQSGNGEPGIQTTIANRPVLTLSCVNSLPCADGTNNRFVNSNSVLPSGTVITYFSVEFNGTFTGFNLSIMGDNTSNTSMLVSGGADHTQRCEASANLDNANLTDSSWHVVGCVINGVSSANYIDDATAATGNTGSNNYNASNIRFLTNTNPSNIKGVEGIAWQGSALTSSNFTAYCHNRRLVYSTPGAC